MTDVNSTYTSLKDAINIGLSCLGETPVSAPDNTSTNVVLAKQIIEEVSRDIQSKGWWFNTSGSDISLYANSGSGASENFSTSIPEEARRYIAIRAARVLQSRFVGSEELLKFSFQEEQVSLAILTQAHVRNGGGSTSFNSFPADLKGMGVEEVLFLQQSAEEKLLSLRLVTELKSGDKLAAETALIADQEDLVEQQVLTEVEETAKRTAEKGLIDAQKSQVQTETVLKSQQALTELENTAKVTAETSLVGEQENLIEKQALDVAADTTLKGLQGSLVGAQTTDVAADTTLKGKQGSLVDAQATDVAADTTLKGKQGSLVDAQATDVGADTTLKGKQGSLVDAQATDVAADTSLKGKQGTALDADTALKTSQKTQLDAQTAIEVTAEKAFFDGVVAGTQNTYRDFAAEMRMMGVQEAQFQGTPAYKKIELLSDANKLRIATATETGSDATELAEVNKVMRFIGESPVTALNSNSLASECVRLLRDTNTELQGRGWWFNTEHDVEFTPSPDGRILLGHNILSIEINGIPTEIRHSTDEDYLVNRSTGSLSGWTSKIKAKVIYERTITDTPKKYREYLSVRVAIILTELYPQSGVDIQRLPKMEQELRAYFKDREADDANYSVFDNYDTASRIGINRNYDLS